MSAREDGRETRHRLLNAACEVFAEKGFHNARVAEICRRAGANVAAVNYYFGDKGRLYAETWRHAFNACAEPATLEAPHDPPEKRLRIYVHNLIKNFTDQDTRGQFTRLYLMELANPTGLIQDIWHDLIEPRRQRLLSIIRQLLGAKCDEEMVCFCELSIISQCRALLTIRRSDLEYLLGKPLSPDLVQRLVNHITRFSLAGIQVAARRRQTADGLPDIALPPNGGEAGP